MKTRFIKLRVNGRVMLAEIYDPISKARRIIGTTLIGAGVVTIFAPTGSIGFIFIGAILIGVDYKEIISDAKFIARERFNDFRTSKFMKRFRK